MMHATGPLVTMDERAERVASRSCSHLGHPARNDNLAQVLMRRILHNIAHSGFQLVEYVVTSRQMARLEAQPT